MVNLKGANKKYKDKEWDTAQLFISESFRENWDIICKLSNVDNDQDFLDYCSNIEEINVKERKSGRRNLYVRWILSEFVLANQDKLSQLQNERKNNTSD